MSLGSGTRLGPYEILALLGAGGMGEVYRARDTRLGRDVAVKVLPASHAADSALQRRFEHEAQLVAALNHPNILDIHDVGTHAGSPYLVTELLEGETLAERIRRGHLQVPTAVDIALQMVAGLAAAHAKGIVHRDLKPSNVFLTTEDRVKLLDFGLAKFAVPPSSPEAPTASVAPPTQAGSVMGTIGYMAPEQLRGERVDARTDVFAFGCVLYEMVSGRRAFAGPSAADVISAILTKEPPPLSSLAERIPAPVEQVIRRCLEKRPEDRFDSAHDLGEALRVVLSGPAKMGSETACTARTSPGARVVLLLSPRVALPTLAVLVVAIVAATWWLGRRATLEWARGTAIPDINRLADRGDNVAALIVARQLEARLPGDPRLPDIWSSIATDVSWNVTPKGAAVFVRNRGNADGGWITLGNATGKPLRTPRGSWPFRFEHPGREPVEATLAVEWLDGQPIDLPAAGEIPAGMVRITQDPGVKVDFTMDFLNYDRTRSASIASFLMDRYEVTNAEFKTFVAAGGYTRREFWKEAVVRDGRTMPWEDAIALFRDTTGRPGPATWEFGSFPEGHADYPVTGVSWYEAAAYAEFAGKRLPTVYHWELAAGISMAGVIIPGSNFSGTLAPVGKFRDSLTDTGLYDTAGNAREWCSNAADGMRFALGGAAVEAPYYFVMPESRPPIARDDMTGFRCMKVITPASASAELEQPVRRRARPAPDPAERLDDAGWAMWRKLLAYQKSTLDEKLELRDDSSPFWRMEKISFASAYASERVLAYLFLPKHVSPPYQCLVYWGPANDWFLQSSDNGQALFRWPWDYFVKTGRCVIYPVLKGTFERGVLLGTEGLFEARDKLWNDLTLTTMSTKDISRSIDYLETRGDIDKERIGLLGFSSGAYYAVLPCAVERRIKTCLLRSGGAPYPGVLGWARRVTTPVLMVNGRYDDVLPYEQCQRPLFDALATPRADKKHEVFPTSHGLMGKEKETMKVTLDWLDKYLGPVK